MNHLELHPSSIRAIKKGHPWITKDSYSIKFPANLSFLNIHDPRDGQYLGTFFHDPKHPKIKARLWDNNFARDFKQQLYQRLNMAYQKRLTLFSQRDNIMLTFGEADQLPGLFIQKLGETILIQYQAFFWKTHLPLIAQFFSQMKFKYIWAQPRLPGTQKTLPTPLGNKEAPASFVIEENGIKYQIRLDNNHDIGLYTDMAAIRTQLADYFMRTHKILNLFSYTGAFSLQGLTYNKTVSSVDSSKSYMDWLNTNIELNGLSTTDHNYFTESIEKFLREARDSFDLIICDPPSLFTSQGKKINALDFYKTSLRKMLELLTPNGTLLLFLNNHSITRNKFNSNIEQRLPKNYQISRTLRPDQDCAPLPNFPEGDYLKGLIIDKIRK